MEIFAWILFGLVLFLLVIGIFGFLRNEYCFQKTLILSKWIFYYKVITDEDDIDYDIDDFDKGLRLVLNPFRWTMRSMCNDKAKYDKLKKFIVEHPNEIAEIREYIKEIFDRDV